HRNHSVGAPARRGARCLRLYQRRQSRAAAARPRSQGRADPAYGLCHARRADRDGRDGDRQHPHLSRRPPAAAPGAARAGLFRHAAHAQRVKGEEKPMAVSFRTTLQATGGTTTGLVVPPEEVEALGGGRRPKVTATLNGYSYRTSVAFMGGEFWLGVSAEHRGKSGLKAGDALDVTLELDTAPREVEVPPDLA